MPFDKSLDAAARRLGRQGRRDFHGLPAPLRERTLASLPDPSSRARKNPTHLPAKIVVAALLLLAVFWASVGTRSRLIIRPARADEVLAAIARAGTWHFSGWRIKEGRRLKWEIWGRRHPFFYREQVGDETLIDDGRQRTQILPERPGGNGSNPQPGLVLIRRSTAGNPESLGDPRAGFLAGISGELTSLTPSAVVSDLNGREDSFESAVELLGPKTTRETSRLTVDRRTRLPVSFTIESQTAAREKVRAERLTGAPTVIASLRAEYDRPFPDALTRFAPPAEYAVADLTQPCRDPEAHRPGTATAGGLTVKATAERNRAGDLHVRFRGWVGSQPYSTTTKLPLALTVSGRSPSRYCADDTGRAYVEVDGPESGTNGVPDLWFVPIEPIAENAPRPKRITLQTEVSLDGYERIELGGGRYTSRSISVVREAIPVVLPLPAPIVDLGYDRPEYYRDYAGAPPLFALSAAQERADYWTERAYFYTSRSRMRPEYLPQALRASDRAIHWWRVAAAKSARAGDSAMAKAYLENAASESLREARERRGAPP